MEPLSIARAIGTLFSRSRNTDGDGNNGSKQNPKIHDLEKTMAWKFAGYPAFSRFMAYSKDCFTARRFAELNIRSLLKLQNNIVELERELKSMDEYTQKLPDAQGGSGSFRLDADSPRQELLDDIGVQVHEYNTRLAAFLKIADRPTTTPEQIENLQNWLQNRPNAIEASEQEFLDEEHEHDLFSIRTSSRTHFGSWLESLGIWKLARIAGSSKSQTATRYYDRNLIKSLGGTLLLLATLALLLGPLWSMTFVRGAVTRVALITAFTTVLSLLLILGTTMKAPHRSIVTAWCILLLPPTISSADPSAAISQLEYLSWDCRLRGQITPRNLSSVSLPRPRKLRPFWTLRR